jgi:hypothetical protein
MAPAVEDEPLWYGQGGHAPRYHARADGCSAAFRGAKPAQCGVRAPWARPGLEQKEHR